MDRLYFFPSEDADLSLVVMTMAPFAIIRQFHEVHLSMGVSEVIYYIDDVMRSDLASIRALPQARIKLLTTELIEHRLHAQMYTARKLF